MKRILLLIILILLTLTRELSSQSLQELMDSCIAYQQLQDYQSALKWALQAEVKAKELNVEMDTNYIAFWQLIAYFYYQTGNVEKAIEYSETIEPLIKQVRGEESPEVANSIGNLGLLYLAKGDFNKAEQLFTDALLMNRRLFKTDHPELAESINNMAGYFEKIGGFEKAEQLNIEALSMRRRLFKNDHPDLANSINNMAAFYYSRGDYNKSEPLYIEAVEMHRRLYKTDHPALATSINNIANFYYDIGDFTKAELLFIESLEMRRRLFRTDHPELAVSINNMAYYYNSIGNIEKAEPLLIESLEMRRRLHKTDHPNLAISINNMAHYYSSKGEFNNAEMLLTEALEMARRIYKTDHPDLAVSINNMASLYHDIGNSGKAESLLIEVLEMCRRLYKGDHPYLANCISNMAYFCCNKGDFSQAEKLYTEAFEMRKRLFKTNHQDLAHTIYNIAKLYYTMNDYNKAESFFSSALDMYLKIISNFFPSLSDKEKNNFWKKNKEIFENYNSFVGKRMLENPFILCRMFDNQLITKAILFNSANKIRKRIINSGDSSLIADFKELLSLKYRLVKFYSMTQYELEKQKINLDLAENIINILEKKINLKSEEYKQSYEKKTVSWRTIQSVLKPDEAVVEMVRYRYFDKDRLTDTVCYAALIVSDETTDNPAVVILDNGKELEETIYPAYRKYIKMKAKDKESFKYFWEKIYEKTSQYKKIYFSPDGIYNKLNISTLEMPDGKYLLDRQEIQTLNSSKDLLVSFYTRQEESNVYNSAVLIGNPNFALSEEELIKESKKVRSDNNTNEKEGEVRGIQLTKLPGTEKEISDIEKFLKTKGWIIKSYLGDMAVKTAVKNANSPRILHIATHGLFLEDVKRSSKELFGFEEQKMVENPLLRSGLFFTGADNYIKNENSGFIEEDNGLLTAYEAMNLSLDKTELVVLSACETGLGEIQNGEGVFGLRRAFQQAGAKSVLMSLWKVSDDATQMLMSNFYRNWVSGMAKREAFAKAQQQVRAKYSDPYYWGAFVMVGE